MSLTPEQEQAIRDLTETGFSDPKLAELVRRIEMLEQIVHVLSRGRIIHD